MKFRWPAKVAFILPFAIATILVVFRMALLEAQEPQFTRPTAVLDLHTNPERRVGPQMHFDSSGRLLILYRENGPVKPNGNWHLIQLTNFLSGKPLREDITFAIPQEPTYHDGTPWAFVDFDFLLTSDSSRAYAIFRGHTATARSGMATFATLENIDEFFFQAAVSFDLTASRLMASADISGLVDSVGGQPSVTDDRGNLIVLNRSKEGVQNTVFDASLRVVRKLFVPYPKDYRFLGCSPRPDLRVECALDNLGGAVVFDSESTHRITASSCHPPNQRDLWNFGLKETIVATPDGDSTRPCARDEEGRTARVSSSKLVPNCSWRTNQF